MTFNVALIGPYDHGKTMLAACLVRARSNQTQHGRPDKPMPPGGVWITTRNPDARFVAALADKSPTDPYSKLVTTLPRMFSFGHGARHYVGIDTPGLAHLSRRNTCHVLAAVDAVIVVVSPLELRAEDEALLREQLSVARHVGIERGVVLLNKTDHLSTDSDRGVLLAAVRATLREILQTCGFADEFPIVVGATGPTMAGESDWDTGRAVEAALDRLPEPVRDQTGPLRLPVLFDYRIAGRGVVAAGVLQRGSLEIGADVTVLGAPRAFASRHKEEVEWRSSIASLQIFGVEHTEIGAGAALGALVLGQRADGRSLRQPHPIVPESGFRTWEPTELVTWGMTLVQPGSAHTARRFRARWWFPAHLNPRPLSGRTSYLICAGAGHEAGAFELDAKRWIQPGDRLTVTVELATPMFVEPGMRVMARADSIVALGEVVDLEPLEVLPRASRAPVVEPSGDSAAALKAARAETRRLRKLEPEDRALRAALLRLADLEAECGNDAGAEEAFVDALGHLHPEGYALARSFTWQQLGATPSQAFALVFRSEGPRWSGGWLAGVAVSLFERGRPADAVRAFDAAIERGRRARNGPSEQAWLLASLGAPLIPCDLARAKTVLEQALALLTDPKDSRIAATAHLNLASLCLDTNQLEAATQHLEQAEALSRERAPDWTGLLLVSRAMLDVANGLVAEGIDAAARALAMHADDPRWTAIACSTHGFAKLCSGDHEGAYETLRRAHELLHANQQTNSAARAACYAAVAQARSSEHVADANTSRILAEAEQTLRSVGDRHGLVIVAACRCVLQGGPAPDLRAGPIEARLLLRHVTG